MESVQRDRIITENAELQQRIRTLREFNTTTSFLRLLPSEQSNLRDQVNAMQVYSDILGRRIEKSHEISPSNAYDALKDSDVLQLYWDACAAERAHFNEKNLGEKIRSGGRADSTRNEFFVAVCEWAKSKGAVL